MLRITFLYAELFVANNIIVMNNITLILLNGFMFKIQIKAPLFFIIIVFAFSIEKIYIMKPIT